MPVIKVKGVSNPINFPDDMSLEQIKAVLQEKFKSNLREGVDPLTPMPQTVEPVEKSLVGKVGQGISDFLYDKGVISNRYGAQQAGESIAGIGEFLPGFGDATAGDDFGRAVAEGDKFGMGVGLLSAIPLVGKHIKEGGKKIERLYHASPVEFDEFDPSRVGDRMTSLGLGHYLTPSKSKANQYGENLMQFDVDTTDIFDWKNPTSSQREEVERKLLEIIPEERISHFGGKKFEVVPRNNKGLARLEELQEKTKGAYNDYAKARVLSDDEISIAIPDFDFANSDDVVIGWREGGNLKGANNEQLMTLMNEYSPNLIKGLGYKGARFGDEVALFDHKLAKKIKPVNQSLPMGDAAKKVFKGANPVNVHDTIRNRFKRTEKTANLPQGNVGSSEFDRIKEIDPKAKVLGRQQDGTISVRYLDEYQPKQVNKSNPNLFEFDPDALEITENDTKRIDNYKGRSNKPISVTKKDGDYFILDGHHRAKIAKENGENVKAVVIPFEDVEKMKKENIHQGDMFEEWVARGDHKPANQ